MNRVVVSDDGRFVFVTSTERTRYLGQLEALLKRHQFLPERHVAALFQPPSARRSWLKSAPVFERMGRSLPTMIAGGAIMVEATKRVQPPRGTIAKREARQRIKALDGLAEPI